MGAQLPRAQKLQWFLSESTWNEREDPTTAPTRTKLKIAVDLVRRAVVADSFYGEDRGVKQGLRALGVGYVLALKPSHAWWHPRSGDRLVPGGPTGGCVEERSTTWQVGDGDPHVPRWLFAGLMCLGSRHRPL